MSAIGPKTNSLERLVPSELSDTDSTGQETLRLHLERYDFASRFVSGGRVLDCACGVGYGSARLAELGAGEPFVTGVDIDAKAVEYATNEYANDRVSFACCDGSIFDADPFDTIVSFETIEHVPHPDALVRNLSRLLKPKGKIVASVPVTPSIDVNPFHLHDFSRASFVKLFRQHGLQAIESLMQVQRYDPIKMLKGEEERLDDMRQGLVSYYAAHPRAAIKRAYSTVVDGFCNKYLVCAFEKAA